MTDVVEKEHDEGESSPSPSQKSSKVDTFWIIFGLIQIALALVVFCLSKAAMHVLGDLAAVGQFLLASALVIILHRMAGKEKNTAQRVVLAILELLVVAFSILMLTLIIVRVRDSTEALNFRSFPAACRHNQSNPKYRNCVRVVPGSSVNNKDNMLSLEVDDLNFDADEHSCRELMRYAYDFVQDQYTFAARTRVAAFQQAPAPFMRALFVSPLIGFTDEMAVTCEVRNATMSILMVHSESRLGLSDSFVNINRVAAFVDYVRGKALVEK